MAELDDLYEILPDGRVVLKETPSWVRAGPQPRGESASSFSPSLDDADELLDDDMYKPRTPRTSTSYSPEEMATRDYTKPIFRDKSGQPPSTWRDDNEEMWRNQSPSQASASNATRDIPSIRTQTNNPIGPKATDIADDVADAIPGAAGSAAVAAAGKKGFLDRFGGAAKGGVVGVGGAMLLDQVLKQIAEGDLGQLGGLLRGDQIRAVSEFLNRPNQDNMVRQKPPTQYLTEQGVKDATPTPIKPSVSAPQPAAGPPDSTDEDYTVEEGDNLWSITKKLYGDDPDLANRWRAIIAANPSISKEDRRAGLIYAGEKIKTPGRSKTLANAERGGLQSDTPITKTPAPAKNPAADAALARDSAMQSKSAPSPKVEEAKPAEKTIASLRSELEAAGGKVKGLSDDEVIATYNRTAEEKDRIPMDYDPTEITRMRKELKAAGGNYDNVSAAQVIESYNKIAKDKDKVNPLSLRKAKPKAA